MVRMCPSLPKAPVTIYSTNHTLGREGHLNRTRTVGHTVKLTWVPQDLVSPRLPIRVGAGVSGVSGQDQLMGGLTYC